jgi:hypothetical protein
MRHSLLAFLCWLLVACVPEQTRSLDPDDSIMWRASVAALERVVMPVLHDFDPSLRNAYINDNGSASLDVTSRELDRQKITVSLVKLDDNLSSVQVTQIGMLKLEPGGFAARLERAILEACAKAFERTN